MTEPDNVKKTTGLNTENSSSEEYILDSDALFDLDMPLDEPQPSQNPNQTGSIAESYNPMQEDTDRVMENLDSAGIDDNSEDSVEDEDILSIGLGSVAEHPIDMSPPLLPTSSNNPESFTSNSAEELETLFSTLGEPGESINEDNPVAYPTDGISGPDSIDNMLDIEHELFFRAEQDMVESQPDNENVSEAIHAPIRIDAAKPPAGKDRGTGGDGDHRSAPASDNKQPTGPQSNTKSNTEGARDMKLANTMIYILGAVLALIAGGAAWLASSAVDRVNELARSTTPIVQENRSSGQTRERHLSTLDSQLNKQAQAYGQRIDALEQQVHTLTMVLSNSASKQWQQSLSQSTAEVTDHNSPAGKSETAASPDTVIQQTPKKTTVKPHITPDVPVQAVKATPTPTPTPTPTTSVKTKTASAATNDTGAWVVNLSSVDSQKSAEREVAKYKRKGINAEFTRIHVKGKIWYRLRVTGFTTEHAAIAYEKYLKDFKGIDVWRQKL